MAKKTRHDGLSSTLTGVGAVNLDKLVSYKGTATKYTEKELSNWFSGCSVFKKICTAPIDHMVRNGFKVKVRTEDVTDDIEKFFKEKDIHANIENSMLWSRLFGGAGLILITDDFVKNAKEPLNVNSFSKILKIRAINCFNLNAFGEIENDLISDNYGKPKKYQIASSTVSEIDPSRVIRVDLNRATEITQQDFSYWSPSILSGLDDELKGYMASMRGSNYLLSENGVKIIMLSKLDEMLSKNTMNEDGTVNNSGDEALKTRLKALEKALGQIRGLVIGEGDKIERLMTNFAGVPEMLQKSKDALCAATNMPHTVLFNESPSGLGATGNSEMTNWNQEIRQMQENFYRPILEKIIELYFWETKKQKTDFTLEFNALEVATEKEIAEIQEKRVNTAAKAIESGIADPVEVRKGFSQTSVFKLPYEIDLNIDTSLNNAGADDSEANPTA